MIIAACLAVAVATLMLFLYCGGFGVSPDGRIYLAAARGESVPRPFHLRPILPMVLRENLPAWGIAAALGLVLATVCVGLLAQARGLDAQHAIAAAALFVALPICGTTVSLPMLVDGPALGLTGLSALLAATGHPLASIGVACVGAGVKEQVPIFAALAAWSPVPLVGCVVTLAIAAFVKPAPSLLPWAVDPIGYARTKQAPRLLDITKSVLPWGACLACLFVPTLPVISSLVVAYAMLFVAADSTRIYQWAAIPVCVAASSAIPAAWLLPVLVAHLFNPWRGDV